MNDTQILTQYLQKLGLENFEGLSKEERETYFEWQQTLEGRKIGEPEFLTWVRQRKQDLVVRIIRTDISQREDIALKMELAFTTALEIFLNGPNVEREAVVREIKSNIEKIK